jgi:hypothetical protein
MITYDGSMNGWMNDWLINGQSDEASKIEQQLAATDSIMEPNVISLIPKFLKAGGTPQQVLNPFLDDHY